MDTQYNYEKTAQWIMKSTQAYGAREQLGKQALKDQSGRLTRPANHRVTIWHKLLALLDKEAILNN